MEKLVEELDNACRVTMTVGEFWQKAITLILSAVRDGELELPGEVGRRDYYGLPRVAHKEEHLGSWMANKIEFDNVSTFTALRKEEGQVV